MPNLKFKSYLLEEKQVIIKTGRMDKSKSQINNGNDYYESDDEIDSILKNSPDYNEVLKTLFTLNELRKTAIEDYKKVVEIKQKLLENPLKAVEMLETGQDLGIPPMYKIPELPRINFAKYNVKIPEDLLKQIYPDDPPPSEEEDSKTVKEGKKEKKNKVTSDTFNKPWSVEEQKTLEDLLRIYPSEAVESKRFEKIAAALGTRTAKQVTSRVQKYFQKLAQSGLPIPGRIPKNEKYVKKKAHKHQRHNHYLEKPTTFFPHLCTPVTMNDLDEPPVPDSLEIPSVSNYLLPSQLQDTNIKTESNSLENNHIQKDTSEIHLDLLKQIREEKLREASDSSAYYVHIGYRCCFCKEEPIVGGRWDCIDCETGLANFCTDCMLAQMCSEKPHPVTHRFKLYHNETEDSSSDSGSCSGSAKDNIKKNSESSDSESCDEGEIFLLKKENITSETLDSTVNPGNVLNSEVDTEEGLNISFDDPERDRDLFSDTQIVSYDYLHSHLFLEDHN